MHFEIKNIYKIITYFSFVKLIKLSSKKSKKAVKRTLHSTRHVCQNIFARFHCYEL